MNKKAVGKRGRERVGMAACRLKLLGIRSASIFSQHRSPSRGLPLRFHLSKGLRGIHDSINKADEDLVDPNTSASDSEMHSGSVEVPNPIHEDSNVKYKAFSSLKSSMRHDMAMIFTCKVCETRSVKTLCRESYEKGVVVARCGGCNNLHLIADRLGWFGEPASVEDLLAAQGEEARKGSIDTLNLTLEDLIGTKSS